MLKKDVWKLFKAHAGGTIHDEWRFVGAEADELCGAIAQAAEEELIAADARWSGIEADNVGKIIDLEAELAALQAQVAMMAEALRALVADPEKEGQDALGGNGQGSYCVYCLTDDYDEHMADCPVLQGRKALSAAPKVVWHESNRCRGRH